MATLAYSNRISAIPTYERFLANKMTCAKFQNDMPKTERLAINVLLCKYTKHIFTSNVLPGILI